MKRRFLTMVAALALGVGLAHAQSDEAEPYAATPAQLTAGTFTYVHRDLPGNISSIHKFEIVFASTPGTATISVTPCMRGGTCGTAVTSSSTANQVLELDGLWDVYNVAVTWTGTETSVKVNITGTHASARASPTVPVLLPYASTLNSDVSTGTHFRVMLTADATLATPANPTDGKRVIWEFIQDSAGNHKLTLSAAFAFGTAVTGVTLTTTPNKRDFVGATYNATTSLWYVLSFSKGY